MAFFVIPEALQREHEALREQLAAGAVVDLGQSGPAERVQNNSSRKPIERGGAPCGPGT